jgi:ubiquinone biosynthesis protein
MEDMVGVIVVVTLLAAIAPRLLGLRVGKARAAAAAFSGLVCGGIAVGTTAQRPGRPPGIGEAAMVLGLAVLATMGWLVAAEAVAPATGGPWPLAWLRALRRRLRRARRYSQISGLAARHGFGSYLRGRRHGELETSHGRALRARALREALEAGGVTFVKLGQLLSSRSDLLPPEFTDELSRLHDRAAPAPWERVERLLTDELGAQPETLFTAFDRAPLAAASIAQVHHARLEGSAGSDLQVAVKVQRPGIRPTVEQDLDILLRIAGRLDERAPWAGRMGILALARGLAAALREELDFRIEAANLRAVAAASGQRGGERVHTPVPYDGLGTSRVLVMEWLDGTPLAAAQRIQALTPAEVQRTTTDELASLLPTARSIVRRGDRLAGALEQGRLTLNLRLFAHPDDRWMATAALQQVLLAFLGAALGIMATLLLGGTGGPRLTAGLGLHQLLGYGILTVASLLILRVLAGILQPRR